MKKLICLLLLGVTLTASAQKHNCEKGKACAKCENPYKRFTQNLPFQMPEVKAPQFPDRQVNLRDFGAVDDGVTLKPTLLPRLSTLCQSRVAVAWSFLRACGSQDLSC